MQVVFGPSGSTQHTVTGPKGTRCVKLDSGSNPWVVNDFGFISEK